MPVFKELDKHVKSGAECKRVLSACGKPNYQAQLQKELAESGNSELWRPGKAVRDLRPKEDPRVIAKGTKGIGSRAVN